MVEVLVCWCFGDGIKGTAFDIFMLLHIQAIKVVMLAQEEARRLGMDDEGACVLFCGGKEDVCWCMCTAASGASRCRTAGKQCSNILADVHTSSLTHTGHNFVGTEQILLGLIGESTGIAAKVLKSMGVNLKDARVEVEKIIGRGSGFVAVEIPFTPRAKRVLELSLEEARQLGMCVALCGCCGVVMLC